MVPATNRAGTSHLCLLVDDLRAAHASLSAQGVRFKSEPVEITAGPNLGSLVVYMYDPGASRRPHTTTTHTQYHFREPSGGCCLRVSALC